MSFIGRVLEYIGFSQTGETIREHVERVVNTRKDSDHSLCDEERQIIRQVLGLNAVTVADIMVPRADIVAISRDITFERLKAVVANNPFTRLVVYHKTLDDMKGFIHVKDIYQLVDAKNFSIKSIIRKPLLVVESLPILDLLTMMQQTRVPIALVIDEFGGVNGLVTTWDIVRQLLGEVEDSHEPDIATMLILREDGVYEADARLPVQEFSEIFGISLTKAEKDDEIDTVGGLIIALAGRVPERRELIRHPGGVEFEILDADPRRVLKVNIRKMKARKEKKVGIQE